MRYINREYGIEGRPPAFKDYYEESDKGPMITAENYPEGPIIGAGLDPKEPYGAMLIGEHGSRWGIKLSCNIRGRWIDSKDYLKDIGRLYAVSKSGNFTYFAYGDMTATVVKYNTRALVMSIATMDKIRLRITFYSPKPCTGELRPMDNLIKGASDYLAVIPGITEIKDNRSIFKERYEVIGDPQNKEYFTAKVYRKPDSVSKEDGQVTFEYDLQGRESRLFLYAAVGGRDIFNSYPEEPELVEGTSMEEIAYSTRKTLGRGNMGRNAGGFLNSSQYHRVYNPFIRNITLIESRTNTNKYFTFKGTDMNVASIIAAHIGDFKAAFAGLPLSVKDESLAPLALWIVYNRSRDRELLKKLFRDYSRKYIPSGELSISKDKRDVAMNMDNSPLKEINVDEPMYSLDKSCYNLLAMDIMERICILTGATEGALYASAKERLKNKINETLWNPRLGIYMNRYVSGEFSGTIGITSFYPLIAGAVDGLDKLEKLIANLRDKDKFYGSKMIPTLSKDHPEYGVKFTDSDGNTVEPYQGYRGIIIPYMNYLVYLGLIRYGVYDLAGEIAERSAVMWYKQYSRPRYEVLDSYLPGRFLTRNVNAQEIEMEKHSLSGNIMALMGLSELIDVEYFRDDLRPAIRFGTIIKGENSVSRVKILGREMSVFIDDDGVRLNADGDNVLIGSGGRFLVRQFLETIEGAEFAVRCENQITLMLKLPIFGITKEETSLTFTIPEGVSEVSIVNGRAEIKPI